MKRFVSFFIVVIFIMSIPFINASAITYKDNDQLPYNSYTYWYDYSGSEKKAVYNKPLYTTNKVIDSISLGLETPIQEISDIYTNKLGKTYILDSKGSSVVIVNQDYTLNTSFTNVKHNEEIITFKNALGIFATDDGAIYIADTENERVICCDETGVVKKIYYLPDSRLIPSSFKYKPIKVAMDSRGYLYVLSDGSYYGAILYSPNDEFLGFYGANTVKSSVSDVIVNLWNKLILNDKKHSSMESKLPYQFTDLYIDTSDFVYTATGNTSTLSNGEEQKGQIRKLSPGGKDVLGSDEVNYGDTDNGHYSQDILGVTVDAEGYIYALDSAYGHIFIYNQKNTLIGAFGSGTRKGEQKGSFTAAKAITLNGSDVIVADSTFNQLTVFQITEYGELVKNAQRLTDKGDYKGSKELWQSVFSQDRNNQLSYIGLAKAFYEEENFAKSMEFAKIGCDRETYALSFKEVRNEWINNNFYWIVLVIALIVIGIIFLIRYLRKKQINIIPKDIKTTLSIWAHPSDVYDVISKKKTRFFIISIILLLLLYVTTVMKDMLSGFCFNYFNSSSYNAVFVFLQTAGLVVLLTVCFWGVSTLMLGRGKMIDIFIVICHSLQPIIVSNVLYLILTNFALPSEIGFLNIISVAMTMYSAFLLIMGLMRISEYGFSKFVGVSILTICGMVCILFVGIVVFLLFQTFIEFIKTIASEINKIVMFGG